MPERSAQFAIVAAFAVLAFLFLAPGYIRPDSVAVFSYLRSAVADGDFAFFNEWASAGMVRGGVTMFSEVTPTGALANHWWIGTSILSAPSYLIAHLFKAPRDGFSGIYGVVLAMTNVGFAAWTMAIAWSFIKKKASIPILATVIGTPFFWYAYVFPLGTHMAGAFAIALVFVALFRSKSGAAAGLATGLAIIVRLQHFVIIPAVLYVAWQQRRRLEWWLAAIGGGALAIACQAAAWLAIYGTPLGPITRGATLAGTTWMPFRNIALLPVLFSSYHGLFAWAPVVFLALLGWIAAARSFEAERSMIAVASLLMFAGEWIANGTFDRYWWGGMSFGPRRFVDLALPIAIGLAYFATAISPRVAYVLMDACSLWSIGLMAAAEAHTISLAHFVTGADLLHAVSSSETWRRLGTADLHSPITNPLLAKQAFVALLMVAAVGLVASMLDARAVTIGMAVALAAIIVVSARTPSRARASAQALHIDMAASKRVGPLLDERGLLMDELAWRPSQETVRELQQIDGILRQH
ncbi:MAG TPA: hypothetical protein VH087_06660 [Thermoanaerobaculia bacterium]|nr:hypothetical protein [Thermoanaerobaculia bacterium]